jgi:hypothetical protein
MGDFHKSSLKIVEYEELDFEVNFDHLDLRNLLALTKEQIVNEKFISLSHWDLREMDEGQLLVAQILL